MVDQILAKLKIPPFKPLPFLYDGRAQTVANLFYPYNPFTFGSQSHLLTLSDGDKLVLTENAPHLVNKTSRIIVLIHGLSGDHNSPYMIRATQHYLKHGYRVIRVNLRGCGPGRGLAKLPYHSGRSEDARAVVEWLAQRYPQAQVTVVGFSLGANIALKLAGEDRDKPSGHLDSVIAVSPPIDLKASVETMLNPLNRQFDQYFVKRLQADVRQRAHLFPDLPGFSFPGQMNLYLFDDMYTAKICGFESADDYYARSSSGPLVPNIRIPTLILHANDDPVVSNAAFEHLPSMDNLDVLLTDHGGHVAWLGTSGDYWRYGNHWMDKVIVEWVDWFEKSQQLGPRF